MACGILVPPPGIEPVSPYVARQSFSHWTMREVLQTHLRPQSLCSGRTGIFYAPLTCWSPACLTAFPRAVSSAWNSTPRLLALATPISSSESERWSVVSNCAIPWTIACQDPGSAELSRQENSLLQGSYWVAIPFSKGSSRPRDQTWVSHVTHIFFTVWATRGFKHTFERGLTWSIPLLTMWLWRSGFSAPGFCSLHF